MKVRLKDDSHVPNVDKLLVGMKSFIGRKVQRMKGAACDVCFAPVADDQPKCMRWSGDVQCPGHPQHEFAKTGEAEDVSEHADHMMAVRDGHLEIVTAKKAKE